MILANQAAALYAKCLENPPLCTVSMKTRTQNVSTPFSSLRRDWDCGPGESKRESGLRIYPICCGRRREPPPKSIINHQVLRTLAKARYDNKPLGHFGLNLDDYCHFTSPIRRYPDTAIHRILTGVAEGITVDRLQ